MNIIKKNKLIITIFLTSLLVSLLLISFLFQNNSNTFFNVNKNAKVNVKEGFEWSKPSTELFLSIQNTINPNKIFDTNVIHQQATQEELDYFLETGMWPWSHEVQELYKKATMNNPYTKSFPDDAVKKARTIYNEKIILEILSWQTKEGQFLLKGKLVHGPSDNVETGIGTFGTNSGLESGLVANKKNKLIKCGVKNDTTNTNNNDVSLMQIKYIGDNGLTGSQMKEMTLVDYQDLETIIPGFTFINGPCNPCVALKDDPEYSCPFLIKEKNKSSGISSIWHYLWNK